MEKDADSKEMLDQALAAGDDWLRKQGVISNFSINTILAWIYVNFSKVRNIEMDVNRPKQQLYIRVYIGFWTLLFMTIFKRKEEFLDIIFNWLSEYLPTYEVSIDLLRWRGGSAERFIDKQEAQEESEIVESEGNVIDALRLKNKTGEQA